LERGAFSKTCYKHDNGADWTAWISEIPLGFANPTGTLAPHGFHIWRRQNMKQEEMGIANGSFDGTPMPRDT